MPRRTELVSRGLEIICDLQEENGGIMATWADDAYPYVYPRDGVMMTMAMNRHGLSERSKKFYRFLSSVRRPGGEVLQRYNRGYPSVTQPNEFDVTPLVLQGILDTYRLSRDKNFLDEMWNLVKESAAFTLGTIHLSLGLVHTVRSIHENQTLEEGFEIWANCAAVKGLLDASTIATEMGQYALSEEWKARSAILMKRVLEKLYDEEKRVFIKNLRLDGRRIDSPDVSQLSPFYFGVCSDDAVLESTLGHLRATLWNETVGGFGRFRDFEIVKDWHWYTGGVGGVWPIFTLWAARFYKRLGMADDAEKCLNFVNDSATGELSLPEKVAPLRGYELWKENETGFNNRVLSGVTKVESGRFKTSIPDYIPWASPLGWAHAEYLLLENEREKGEYASILPELRVRTGQAG